MRDLDRVAGIFFFFLALYMTYESVKLPLGDFHHPDAGFLPFGLSAALLVLSIVLLFQTFHKGHLKEWFTWGEGKYRVWVAALAMVAYVLVLNRLGYLIATFLVMLFLLRGIEKQKWGLTLVITVPSVIISYISFSVYLGVPLPKGIIPF